MDTEHLLLAFSSFNSAAENLGKSYEKLQKHVESLSIELQVTNEKLKQELERKKELSHALETLLESLPSAIIVVIEGKICMTNMMARAWFSDDLAMGDEWSDFIAHFQSTSVTGEMQFISRSHGLMRISIAKTSLSEHPHKELFILHDVTELSSMRESLARKERLEAIGQMTAELSHQIRTPLSSMKIYVHHLNHTQLDALKTHQFLNALQKGFDQIECLVRDMLIFVKGDEYILESVSVSIIIEEVLVATEKKSEAKGVRLIVESNIDTQAYLHCHLSSLVSAIAILVENAIEASDSNQCVHIHLVKHDDAIDIRVIDHGKGIPNAMLSRIFQPFCSMRRRGTGLGLSIVKMVAESHAGQVCVSSHIDEGSVFCMRIPFIK